jgi:hypothetical protein
VVLAVVLPVVLAWHAWAVSITASSPRSGRPKWLYVREDRLRERVATALERAVGPCGADDVAAYLRASGTQLIWSAGSVTLDSRPNPATGRLLLETPMAVPHQGCRTAVGLTCPTDTYPTPTRSRSQARPVLIRGADGRSGLKGCGRASLATGRAMLVTLLSCFVKPGQMTFVTS